MTSNFKGLEIGRTRGVQQIAKQKRYKESEVNPNISPKDIGYIAGFLDSDGSIDLKSSVCRAPSAEISFSNTNLEAIKRIQNIIGTGGIREYDDSDPNHKTRFKLEIESHKSILELAKLIEPHLLFKSEQAKVMKNYIENNMGRSLSPEEIENFQKRLKKLNGRDDDG